MSGTDPQQIEAEIERTRAELRSAVDELSDRIAPKALAQEALDEAKIAVADIKRRVTGEVRDPAEPEPSTTGWVVLGSAAAVSLLVVSKILKRL